MPRILHTNVTAFERVVTHPYSTRRRKEYTRFLKKQCSVTLAEVHPQPASNCTFYGVFNSDDPEFAVLNDMECDLSVYSSSKSILFRRSLSSLPLAMFRITGVEFRENERLLTIDIDNHSVIQFRFRHQNDFVMANGVFNNHRNDFNMQRNQFAQYRDLLDLVRRGVDQYEQILQRTEAAAPRIPIVREADDDDAPGCAGGGGGGNDAVSLRRSRSGSRSSDSASSSRSSVSLPQDEDSLSVESVIRRRSTRTSRRQTPYTKK